jgi:thioesterase domain-containing protein
MPSINLVPLVNYLNGFTLRRRGDACQCKRANHSRCFDRRYRGGKSRGTMQQVSKVSTPASTDAAHALLWMGIIGAARHLTKRQPQPPKQRPTVVQLKPGTGQIPVYFIGAGIYEIHLAPLISSRHPVFAVEITWPSPWHDAAIKGDVDASPTLKEMVALYAAALHAHAGSTPCVIVGYSFQGLIGFEVAHQLKELGGKVELVMLLDASARYPASHCIAWQKLQEVWRPPTTLTSNGQRSKSLTSRLGSSWSILRWTLYKTGSNLKARLGLGVWGRLTTRLDTLGRPLRWRLIERLYANASRSYDLRQLDCRGALFRSDRSEDCPGGNIDFSLGWNGLFCAGLKIIQLTGGHDTMWHSPHDTNLAREISNVLARCCLLEDRYDRWG